MNILVPIDFSEITTAILETARAFSQKLSAKIWLVHVVPPEPDFIGYEPGPQSVRDQVAAGFKTQHQNLQGEATHLRSAGLDVTALLLQGCTADEIVKEATRLQVSMIILGSHGHSALYKLLLGSVTEAVMRKAPCPVLVVPANPSAGVAA